MVLIIVGIILMLGGIGSSIYGIMLVTNPLMQLASAFGAFNPGIVWLIVGIVVLVVGIVLLALGIKKNKKG